MPPAALPWPKQVELWELPRVSPVLTVSICLASLITRGLPIALVRPPRSRKRGSQDKGVAVL